MCRVSATRHELTEATSSLQSSSKCPSRVICPRADIAECFSLKVSMVGFGMQSAWLPAPLPERHLLFTRFLFDAAKAQELQLDNLSPHGPVAGLGSIASQYWAFVMSGCIVGRVPETVQFCWRAIVGLEDVVRNRQALANLLPPRPPLQSNSLHFEKMTSANPRWLTCSGQGFDATWARFGNLLRDTENANTPDVSETLQLADKLIRLYADQAWAWVTDLTFNSVHFCGDKYMGDLGVWAGDDFCVYHYVLGGPEDAWARRRCWKRWASFCPFGYSAALFIRGKALRQAGHNVFAEEDLQMAAAMLGWCEEVDFLDPLIWRVSGKDIQAELFALQAPAPLGEMASSVDRANPSLDHFTDPWPRIWHALQMNTLVRQRLATAAAAVSLSTDPQVAMLTWPSYLILLLLPSLLLVWPDLKPTIFHMGTWQIHEKCSGCMEYYEKHFLQTPHGLRALPLDFTKQAAGDVAWHDGLGHKELLAVLQHSFESHPRASQAEVIFCTAPLWLCASLLLVSARPIISLCLMSHGPGAPPGFGAPEARRVLRQKVVKPLEDAMLQPGAVPRHLWVREDITRSYANLYLREYGHFHPFVSLLSTYITARYTCSETSDVVVMREGSLGRFAPTLRGNLLFTALAHSSPICGWQQRCAWQFKVLPYTKDRLSYEEIARHRAAVFVPLIWYGKMTFKDLITMRIPLFMPSAELQEAVSSVHEHWGCGLWQIEERWARLLCRRLRIRHRLELSSFFRYPHVQQFGSLADLLRQLAALDCPALQKISQQMMAWNSALVTDDLNFWKTAVTAIRSPTVGDASWGTSNTRMSTSDHHTRTVPDLGTSKFALPGIPWLSAASTAQDVDPWTVGGCSETREVLALHCFKLKSEEKAEERDHCCREAVLAATPLPPKATEFVGGVHQVSGLSLKAEGPLHPCLQSISACPEHLLRYGVHLLQHLPAGAA
eukprot:TRINITY_DN24936_c0_g1_i1.p1 TRINITY_DN24936_c0_g1~~TRINITY_DN24936_c0_g1_i1.p1  ORF type:complete len:949 (-),score=74.04 TRINITY_DN24936_c0_g1_i1:620-3466(-)